MIPLAQLLEDKVFSNYFTTTPHLHPVQCDGRLVWRVWIKPTQKSPWRKKDVARYSTAVDLVAARLGDVYDAAVQCRGRAYEPPVKRVALTRGGVPQLDEAGKRLVKAVVWKTPSALVQAYGPHDWCFYCRRPTIFAYISNHHSFRGTALGSFPTDNVRRCTLCGVSHDLNRRPL